MRIRGLQTNAFLRFLRRWGHTLCNKTKHFNYLLIHILISSISRINTDNNIERKLQRQGLLSARFLAFDKCWRKKRRDDRGRNWTAIHMESINNSIFSFAFQNQTHSVQLKIFDYPLSPWLKPEDVSLGTGSISVQSAARRVFSFSISCIAVGCAQEMCL